MSRRQFGLMKTIKQISLWALIPLLMAATSARADDWINAAGPLRTWCIERSSTPQESSDLDNDSLQLIAQQMGEGRFYVRAGKILEANPSVEPARVFFVYSSIDAALKNSAPAKRIFYGGALAKMWIRSGSDKGLVSCFFQSRAKDGWDDKTAIRLVPDVLSAVLYAGRATLWDSEFQMLSDKALEKLRNYEPGRRSELRALCQQPVIFRDATGRLAWKGRFIRADGGVEDVTVILPLKREGSVGLERTEVKPGGYFPEIQGDESPPEEWTVANEARWQPSKRYQFMLTVASLGNTQMKYKLAIGLLAESDGSSIAEGIKWLNAAAADGYKDAMDRLVMISSKPIRPSRDRDGVRMDWCGCSIKKPVAQ